MDPTTAALLGATIGAGASLLAGTVGPWVKDSMERRARARYEQRKEIHQAVVDALTAYVAVQRSRFTGPRDASFLQLHAQAAIASSRLTILISDQTDHDELEKVLAFTLKTISDDKKLQAIEAALRACNVVLEKWYRGEVSGGKIGDEYSRVLGLVLDMDVK